MSRAPHIAMWAACLFACTERAPATPPSAAPHKRLGAKTCADLLTPGEVQATLGHAIAWRGARHDEGRFELLSCENETKAAHEVFAFDVACGSGARERYVTLVRAMKNAIRQSEPKVGDEAWASPNVYLSWHAPTSCYTTVLLSWRRPQPDWLQRFARRLAEFARKPPQR